MKKILVSLLTISVLAITGFALTKAQFSDEEKSTGNTFETGTIDIAVDGTNPWTRTEPYHLTDMKPSQVGYINFVIHNVGSNPVNVTKALTNFKESPSATSEPKCLAIGGIWRDGNCSGGTPPIDLASQINYDLKVWVYSVDPTNNKNAKPEWWQIIYTDAENRKLTDLPINGSFLGMIPKNWYMKVEQSYHMPFLANQDQNKYQGEKLTFDITLNATQLEGVVDLIQKDFANQDNPTIVWSGTKATVKYGVKDTTFHYSLTGTVPDANTAYSFIFYPETWSSPTYNASNWPREVFVLGSTTSVGNNVTLSGSVDLGMNLLNMKVWMVKSADLASSAVGKTVFNNVWNGNEYLFETGMIDYYDSGL